MQHIKLEQEWEKKYINGVEVASGTAGGKTNTNSILQLGKLQLDQPNYNHNGNIDDLRIYDFVF